MLYPATLLNSHICSGRGGSLYSSCDFNVDDGINCGFRQFSFFLFGVPFISFSHLITMTRIFNTMLRRSVERRHLHLVLDLRGESFSLSH